MRKINSLNFVFCPRKIDWPEIKRFFGEIYVSQNVTVRIQNNNLFNFAIGILNPFLDQKLPVGMFSILRSRIIPNILEYLCAFQIFHAFRTCEKYIISLNLLRRKILYPRKKHSQDFQVPEKGPSFSGHLRMTFRGFF